MNLDELNQEIRKIMDERNNGGIPEFDGYSPDEMHSIIHFLFDENCPIRMNNLEEDEFKRVPIFNGVKFLLEKVSANNGIKLTAKGFLPTKIVSELYNQDYFEEEMIEKGIIKLYKETDSQFVQLSRILLEIAGLIKKVKGSLTITVKGKKILDNNQLLLEEVLVAYCKKFNWAYFDGYESENIGRLGCGFSLMLLNKYGNELRNENFYADKYFAAYRMLKANILPIYGTLENYVNNCYRHRMIDQFGLLTGIISVERQVKFREPKQIQKTEMLNKLFECRRP